MSEKKWTPGPWMVRTTEGPNAGDGFDVLGSCVSSLTWIEPDDNQDHAQANAHLIAAAPDLYEALEMALDRMESDWKDIDFEWGPMGDGFGDLEGDIAKGNCPEIVAARSALAKARGE